MADLYKEQQLKEMIINEEYKMWKKQIPFLYDNCIYKVIAERSPSIQWMPDTPDFSVHNPPVRTDKVLLGTANRQEGELVYTAAVDTPTDEYNGGPAPFDNIFSTTHSWAHPGPVTCVRYCPANPFILAVLSETGALSVYDTLGEHPLLNTVEGAHGTSARALGWSTGKGVEARLATGGPDAVIKIWDLQSKEAIHQYELDVPACVNDVSWSPLTSSALACAREDGDVLVYDTRAHEQRLTIKEAHTTGASSVSFSPFKAYELLTGGGDQLVCVYDLRRPNTPLHELHGHQSAVTRVKFSPLEPSLLASSADDRTINIYDLSLKNSPVPAEDEAAGPPELVFIHGGHTRAVLDFDWHPTVPWMLASTGADNILMVWKPASAIVDKEPPSEQ